MSDAEKSDTDVRREMQRAALAQELKQAKTLKEYAWAAIQNGTDVRYVSARYGFSVEELERAKAIHEQREAERRARYER